jgi:ABC-type phosphate transport system permease subunit
MSKRLHSQWRSHTDGIGHIKQQNRYIKQHNTGSGIGFALFGTIIGVAIGAFLGGGLGALIGGFVGFSIVRG